MWKVHSRVRSLLFSRPRPSWVTFRRLFLLRLRFLSFRGDTTDKSDTSMSSSFPEAVPSNSSVFYLGFVSLVVFHPNLLFRTQSRHQCNYHFQRQPLHWHCFQFLVQFYETAFPEPQFDSLKHLAVIDQRCIHPSYAQIQSKIGIWWVFHIVICGVLFLDNY